MSSDDPLQQILNQGLAERERRDLRRHRTLVRLIDSVHVEINGVRYANFSSNNYLGLTHHPRVLAAIETVGRGGGAAGSAASPLITGYTEAHAKAERAIAAWKGTQCAVLLPSGYQANHAAVQAIAGAAEAAGREVRFLIDKLAHASLIDAVRSSGSPFRVFPHNDLKKLTRLLEERERDELQVVLTESIFSMDGDAAPLARLADLKRIHPFTLLLDEAHASGVYGEHGAGYANELKLTSAVDIFVVTLSKSLGGVGGAICASQTFCDAVANFGRAYIYSTSVAPAQAAAAEAAIGVMRDEPQRQRRVRELAMRVRSELTKKGFDLPAGDSPIIPIVLGDERSALEAAAKLKSEGLLVLAMRPPTVPKKSSRLRVTLSCDHEDETINRLLKSLLALRGRE